MKLCNHRYLRNRPSHCLLMVGHLGPKERFEGRYYGTCFPVFRGPEGYAYECGEEMTEVCPYREHKPRPTSAPTQWYDCPHCEARHRTDLSRLICLAKHDWEVALKENHAPVVGTTMQVYSPEIVAYPQFGRVKSHVWAQIVFDISRRDKGICQDCGGHGPFECHHIIARAKGGTDHPANLKLVCQRCHRKYTDDLLAEVGKARRIKNKDHKVKQLSLVKLDDF